MNKKRTTKFLNTISMKKIILIFIVVFTSCNFERPTEFSQEALNNKMISLNENSSAFKAVIEKFKGKKILIDVWASWCADCIKGLPKVKELQKEFPEVVFLFLSVDKNKTAWKRGITRFKIVGEHYLVEKGFDSEFADCLGLSWIPRYMVVDEVGKISLFKATKATDKDIVAALKK